jgi:ribosomal protein S18 acetylase RimI-like enzyme
MNPHSQWLRFVGLLNDEPVAVSILFLGAGVAAIFNVAVVPECRRQGFGTLITREPLLRARSMGYRYGVLKATPIGTKLYKNMKFEECCKISMYVCKPWYTLQVITSFLHVRENHRKTQRFSETL